MICKEFRLALSASYGEVSTWVSLCPSPRIDSIRREEVFGLRRPFLALAKRKAWTCQSPPLLRGWWDYAIEIGSSANHKQTSRVGEAG
jgi:hypothetical protein